MIHVVVFCIFVPQGKKQHGLQLGNSPLETLAKTHSAPSTKPSNIQFHNHTSSGQPNVSKSAACTDNSSMQKKSEGHVCCITSFRFIAFAYTGVSPLWLNQVKLYSQVTRLDKHMRFVKKCLLKNTLTYYIEFTVTLNSYQYQIWVLHQNQTAKL